MKTELINTKMQHYSKDENGAYVLTHEEDIQIERPVGEVMTPQERIEQLEAKLELIIKNLG